MVGMLRSLVILLSRPHCTWPWAHCGYEIKNRKSVNTCCREVCSQYVISNAVVFMKSYLEPVLELWVFSSCFPLVWGGGRGGGRNEGLSPLPRNPRLLTAPQTSAFN